MTPTVGITLSGFASRCDRPSTGIDDPLSVHAIAFEDGTQIVLLLVFDLLGLGAELTEEINSAVRDAVPDARPPILCCTHTHSAPATVELLGCGISDRAYWDLVVIAAAQAASDAVKTLRPATLRFTTRDVAGVSYNRRKILADGRVVMKAPAGETVVKIGPTWDEMFLARFDDDRGNGIVGLCAWAAHPVDVCTQNVSADAPGELRRRLGARYGFPFVYLQGACADINLPFTKQTRADMLGNADRLMEKIGEPTFDRSAATLPLKLSQDKVTLTYQHIPPREQLHAMVATLEAIATTGEIRPEAIKTLASVFNIKPTSAADEVTRHIASAAAAWGRRWIDRYDRAPRTCVLSIAIFELGDFLFPIVAAEVFCETGLKLRAAFPNRVVIPLAYASPLIGYLPPDEALAEGGYEAAQAYRFFGDAAPFAAEVERRAIDALSKLASHDARPGR